MSQHDKILTIGIPTYNGSKYIDYTLNSILQNINNLSDKSKVEVVVVDNNSTDNTYEIVSKYLTLEPNIFKYFKNADNVGYDRNVLKVFEHSLGQYVELLGDDDYFASSNSLLEIIEIIEKNNDLSVIALSLDFFNDIDKSIIITEQSSSNGLFSNGNEFFRNVKFAISAVSSIVIRKSDWQEYDYTEFIGKNWIHVGILIKILSKNRNSYITPSKLIIVRYFVERWGNHFGNQLFSILLQLEILTNLNSLGYEEEIYNIYLNSAYKRLIGDSLDIAPRKFDINLIIMLIKIYWKFPSFWIYKFIWILMPFSVKTLIRKYRRILLN